MHKEYAIEYIWGGNEYCRKGQWYQLPDILNPMEARCFSRANNAYWLETPPYGMGADINTIHDLMARMPLPLW